MRLPRSDERDLLLMAERHREDHIVFPADRYRRADGALPVYRDGLQELLHRRLFRLLRVPHLGRRKLIRTCKVHGCQQPYHFMLVDDLRRGSRKRCGNGHVYTEVGVTDTGHCAICAPLRQAARRGLGGQAAVNAAKCCCPLGHEYDHGNTYRQRTRSGVRRKCRRCNAARAAERRRTTQPASS